MNKHEAIEKIKNIETLNIKDMMDDKGIDMVIKNQVIDLISQIDEPQKPVVPKFVAEWLEYCKIAYRDLQMVLSRLDHDRKVGDWAYDENGDLIPDKVDMIARAWLALLDGYTVEQEKLYTVEIPNPNSNWKYTFLTKKDYRGVIIHKTDDDCWKKDKNNQLTEAEIKKDFEWAFQFAKPLEEEGW